jgi:hypothetical protein
MNMSWLRTRTNDSQDVRQAADEGPGEGGGGLLEQAAAFAAVAREAHADCEKGKAAEQQLLRRRNRSGQ